MIDHTDALAVPDRLEALAAYDLDAPELRERLDALAARTATALGLPVGLITLVLDSAQLVVGATGLDESWMLAAGGVPVEWSFCATTVATGRPYVVSDAAHDPVQHDNPVVALDGLAAYAGVPLLAPDGRVLGAACVLDTVPHQFSAGDLDGLRAASAEAAAVLEDHRRRP